MATEQLAPRKRPLEQTDPPRPPQETLPTMYDLPSESPEDGLPDEFHIYQPQLLRETFQPPTYPPERVFAASDLYLYYDVRQPGWHKRPDWFAVLEVPRLYGGRDLRLSYVIWQEGVAPYLVVELLSPGTEKEDLGETAREPDQPPNKWTVYEQILRVPYYVVYGRHADGPRYFKLSGGQYQEIQPQDQRLWFPEAGLGLGVWSGLYEGLERRWLRFYDLHDAWIETAAEQKESERYRAEQEHARAEQEHARAEQERARADRLAAQLKALGIEPEQ